VPILATLFFSLGNSRVMADCDVLAVWNQCNNGETKPLACDTNGINYCCTESVSECKSLPGELGEDTDIKSGCKNIDPTEFHSLRPYPAKSCIAATENYAKFCGNTLTLQSSIEVPYTPGVDKCIPIAGGKVRCSYIKQGGGNITIDLKDAELPFMGLTEKNVINSQNPIISAVFDSDKNISPAERVNNYVSWYLNGIFNRAEYLPIFFDNPDAPSLVDYSGPLNKLLPQEVQQQARANTVNNASVTRHDQIVGCTYSLKSNFFGFGVDIGKFPAPCYIFGNLLSGFINKIIDSATGKEIDREEWRLSDWQSHIPPVRSNFDNYTDYYKEYRKWRGDRCFSLKVPAIIPILGGKTVILCGDDPTRPNFWSNLYQYIPLSSTEDLEGNIKVDSVSVGGEGVSNVSFSNQTPATLFFPHIQESDELGSILQDTYLAKDEAKTGQNVAVEPPSSCTTVDVRSNKGDNLFAKSISGNLSYTANFTCTFDAIPNPATCATTGNPCDGGKLCCTGSFCNNEGQHSYCRKSSTLAPTSPPTQTCSKTFSVAFSTISNTPKIDDVWSRLVAGPTAVVKKMFPKLGTQIGTLKDLPGSTGITYSGDAQGSGQLNLPHVGGISEYFLKGIQTLLRPKGFGETISFGEIIEESDSGEICDIAENYKIPCCMLKGVIEVETGNSEAFIGSGVCERGNKTFACCNGNYCGPANIACNQYTAWDGGDGLDMCNYEDSAELLARAMLFKLCQADGKCVSGWASEGDYILDNYSIEDGDYTAAAYFYGLQRGCAVTSCSQFRWGKGMGYCEAVKYYCDNGKPIESKTDVSFCEQCNTEEMIPAGFPINCSLYR